MDESLPAVVPPAPEKLLGVCDLSLVGEGGEDLWGGRHIHRVTGKNRDASSSDWPSKMLRNGSGVATVSW